LLPECLKHVRIESQRLIDLLVRLLWSATAAAHQLLGCVFSDEFRKHLRSWPRPGEILLRPLGVVVIRARGPVTFRLFYHTVSLVCFADADDAQTLALRRHDRGM